jgi:hypothetical protein
VVTVDLVVAGLTAGGVPSLGVFDVDIIFDLAALGFSSYVLGPSLGDLTATEALDLSLGDLGGGAVNVAELSLLPATELDALQAASFPLATLQFTVGALPVGGSTTVAISTMNPLLGDAFGNSLPLEGTTDGVIRNPDTSPLVPEPASVLVWSVLAVLGLLVSRCGRWV